jgi:RNA polymerase sigma-70 factor (ECF subfamily)
MTVKADPPTCQRIESIYRAESRRVFATLVRVLGDFDLAEEAMHDAFIAAMQRWPRDGIPHNPRTWLVSAGRFGAIDVMRRRARFDASLSEIAERLDAASGGDDDPEHIEDDQLRLIFTCCHPALQAEARVALTLREICSLTTEEIASVFLVSASTIAQRIVRAKAKIKAAKIPYQVPARADLPERLDTVLHVIYLVFTEGYAASAGQSLTRADLSGEAIRLGRLLLELLPKTEVIGLLALMLLQESRRAARATASGDVILLADQDRSSWNRELIEEGLALAGRAMTLPPFGAYTVQAAIAAVHALARQADQTRWDEIVGFYDLLLQIERSPVVELNRAVALAMRDGPAAGLASIEAILGRGELSDYHYAHAARADLCRQLGQTADARAAYQTAISLARQEPERRFLQQRLDALPG